MPGEKERMLVGEHHVVNVHLRPVVPLGASLDGRIGMGRILQGEVSAAKGLPLEGRQVTKLFAHVYRGTLSIHGAGTAKTGQQRDYEGDAESHHFIGSAPFMRPPSILVTRWTPIHLIKIQLDRREKQRPWDCI